MEVDAQRTGDLACPGENEARHLAVGSVVEDADVDRSLCIL